MFNAKTEHYKTKSFHFAVNAIFLTCVENKVTQAILYAGLLITVVVFFVTYHLLSTIQQQKMGFYIPCVCCLDEIILKLSDRSETYCIASLKPSKSQRIVQIKYKTRVTVLLRLKTVLLSCFQIL